MSRAFEMSREIIRCALALAFTTHAHWRVAQVSEMIGAVAGSKGTITPREFVFAFEKVFHSGRRAMNSPGASR